MFRRVSHIGEFGLIDILKRSVNTTKGVIQGIGDDTAVLEGNRRNYLLFTTDMLVEGVHFTRQMPASAIGHKALACSISDVSAMGGVPTFALISLGLRADCEIRFIKEIYRGINRLAKKFRIAVVGGDTVKSKQVIINVAMLGAVTKKKLVTREGAQEGDHVFVTGRLGGSFKNGRHLTFIPRIKEAQYLVNTLKPSSMIDISDGLVADLGHILKQSRCGAVIYEDHIPVAPGATLQEALYDGEDFELLFTLNAEQAEQLIKRKRRPFSLYHIGEVVDQKEQLKIASPSGHKTKLKLEGFTHF